MENAGRQNNDELEDILREFSEPAPEPEPAPEEAPSPAPQKTPQKKRKKSKALFCILLVFFSSVFLFSTVYLGNYWILQHRERAAYGELADIVASIQGTPTEPAPTEDPLATAPPFVSPTDTPATEPTAPTILPEYQPIYEMNNDTVGWIKIEGTVVNYPVMQKKDTTDYYLDHNFNKQYAASGAIYVREACDVFKPSDNIVIYGHRVYGGLMFSGLQYYTSRSFWKSHQYITFDTLYEHHTYQIFAAFKTSADPGRGYPYHRFNDAVDQADFDQFVSKVKELSFYDTGITPQYGDKLITLSTCEYTLDNGRLVVVAVQVS